MLEKIKKIFAEKIRNGKTKSFEWAIKTNGNGNFLRITCKLSLPVKTIHATFSIGALNPNN